MANNPQTDKTSEEVPTPANRAVDAAPVVDTGQSITPLEGDTFRGPGLDVDTIDPGSGEAGTDKALDDELAQVERQIEVEQKRARLLEARDRLNSLRTGRGNNPVIALPNPLPEMAERKQVFCDRCGGSFQVRQDQADRKAIYDCPFCRHRHESSEEAVLESIKPGA